MLPINQSLNLLKSINTRNFCVSASTFLKDGDPKKVEWYTPLEIKRESWNAPEIKDVVPKNEWRSVFQRFSPKGINRHTVLLLQRPIDFSPRGLQKWLEKKLEEMHIKDQSYKEERVSALGFDLAAATFLVHRGAKVRFKNAKEWTCRNEKDKSYSLPTHYQPGVFVEEIDLHGMDIRYEGLECLKNLKHLKTLNLSGCPEIDDWCLGRICGEFCESLKYLDISNCPKITERGLASVSRLRELESLNLTGLDQINDIKLICILLEETLPNINIIGVQYLDDTINIE